MVKIALIDSGVHLNLLENSKQVILKKGDAVAPHIHGSSMAQIIFSHNQNVLIYSFQVLDMKLRCSVNDLIETLKKIQKMDIDIVHMSLGMNTYNEKLYKICRDIYDSNKMIVAAYSNQNNVSFPADFNFVKGVKSFLRGSKEEYYYDIKTKTIYGYGAKQRIPFHSHIEYGKGNSCAAAHFTGIYSKELQENRFSYQVINENNREELMNNVLPNLEWVKQGLYYPLSSHSIKMVKEENLQAVGIYCPGFEKSMIDGVRIFNDLKTGLSEAKTLLIGDNEKLSLELEKKEKRELIKVALESNKNVFCVSNIDEKQDKDLFDEAKKRRVNLYIKYQ